MFREQDDFFVGGAEMVLPGTPKPLKTPTPNSQNIGTVLRRLRALFGLREDFKLIDRERPEPSVKERSTIIDTIVDYIQTFPGENGENEDELRTKIQALVMSIRVTSMEDDGNVVYTLKREKLDAISTITRDRIERLLTLTGIDVPQQQEQKNTTETQEIRRQVPDSQGQFTGFDMLDNAIRRILEEASFTSIIFSCKYDEIADHFFTCLETCARLRPRTSGVEYTAAILLTYIKRSVSERLSKDGEKLGKSAKYRAPLFEKRLGESWDKELRELERVCGSCTIRRIILVDFDDISSSFSQKNLQKSKIAYRYIRALGNAQKNGHCIIFKTIKTAQTVHAFFSTNIQAGDSTHEVIDSPKKLLFGEESIENSPNTIHFTPEKSQYDKWKQIHIRQLLELACQNLNSELGDLWWSAFKKQYKPFLSEVAWILTFREGTPIQVLPPLDGRESEIDTLKRIVQQHGPQWKKECITFIQKNLAIDIKASLRQNLWEQFCLAIHGSIDTNTEEEGTYGGLIAGRHQVDTPSNNSELKPIFEYIFWKLVTKERPGLSTLIQQCGVEIKSDQEMHAYYQAQEGAGRAFLDTFSLANFLFNTSIVPTMPVKE